MATKTITALPVDDTTAQNIVAWLALSDSEGEPLSRQMQEWVATAIKVAKGLKLALMTDGVIEVDSARR